MMVWGVVVVSCPGVLMATSGDNSSHLLSLNIFSALCHPNSSSR
jgi:hypothetical protein